MNGIGNIINRAKRSNINILMMSTHETANSALANAFLNYNFYFLYGNNLKKWDSRFRKLPENCYLLKDGQIPLEQQFDIIISQNYADQYGILKPLAEKYKIPLVCITHTQPYPEMTKKFLGQVKQMSGDFNVFITKSSMKAWGWDDNEGIVVEHSIDSNVFCPDDSVEKELYILGVCNQFNQKVRWQCCGFKEWEQIIQPYGQQSLPWAVLGSDCGDFAQPAKDLSDLINHYRKAQIFINTSLISPIPMSLLEAAACEKAFVTTATCDIPNIFTNKKDCLMSNNPKELREHCVYLLNNPQYCKELGQAARKTVQERFRPERFRKDWAKVFEKALNLPLT